jgi:hypothetical protein
MVGIIMLAALLLMPRPVLPFLSSSLDRMADAAAERWTSWSLMLLVMWSKGVMARRRRMS